MRAVLYCRVSTKDQIRNLSLSTQEKACREYCRNNSYDVDKIFVEEGESAKTADRTELKRLMLYCRENKGRIHAVIVYAVSRFARERYSHVVLRAQLANLGITLRSATEPIDDSSTGKLIEGMVSTFAQFDNDKRSELTVTGMKARLEKGDWTFKPPLGYVKTLDAAGRKANVPDPVRSPLITKIFDLYSTGLYSKQEVRIQITKMGLVTRKGKPLSLQTISQILRNPFYAGELHVAAWDVRRPSNCVSLTSPEIFDRVQALLRNMRGPARSNLRDNPDFPLRGFVRCGRCGRQITASWSKGRRRKYPYYRCQNRNCKAVNRRREEMEKLFVDFLRRLCPKPEYRALFGEIIIDVWKHKQSEATALQVSAQRQLAALRERKQRLIEAFLYERVIDSGTYQEQLHKLNEELAFAEIEERECRVQELDIEAAVSFGELLLLDAPRLWSESSPDQRRRLQQALFPDGVHFENGNYRTAQTSLLFYNLEEEPHRKEDLVALTGIEPVFRP
jgi:site-specific DNA recombinase